jgi:hypothetical protein
MRIISPQGALNQMRPKSLASPDTIVLVLVCLVVLAQLLTKTSLVESLGPLQPDHMRVPCGGSLPTPC